MKLRSRGMAAAAAALLLLALPVQAQDGGSTVTFDGVGFTFDATLGTSVNITRVRGQAPDLETIETPDARHLVFTLVWTAGRVRQGAARGRCAGRRAGVSDRRPGAATSFASERLEQLRTLLADRPDLGTFMAVRPDGFGEELPFLPVPGAGQILRARAQYIDTPEVSRHRVCPGIRPGPVSGHGGRLLVHVPGVQHRRHPVRVGDCS